MASAIQRAIRFDWYWEHEESIRAGHAVKEFGEVPRWLPVAGWALAAATAIDVPLLVFGASAGDRGALASTLLLLLLACWFALFNAYATLTYPAYAFKQMPGEFMDLSDLGKMPDTRHPITVAISDEGYATPSHDGPGGHAWTYFREARETNEFLLLLFRDRGGYYVPKRAVPAGDLEPIRGILRRHLGEQARLMDAPASDPHPFAPPQPA